MHLTNYSINKHHELYTESEDLLVPNNANKRTLASLYACLRQNGIDTDAIIQNIRQACTRTLSIYAPIIEHNINIATNCKPIAGKYFQILGFDLLIDQHLQPWLLEINDHPSLNIFLEKDYMGGGMGKTLSKIDQYVKKIVVGDAIKLSKKKITQIQNNQQYKSLSRIFPDD